MKAACLSLLMVNKLWKQAWKNSEYMARADRRRTRSARLDEVGLRRAEACIVRRRVFLAGVGGKARVAGANLPLLIKILHAASANKHRDLDRRAADLHVRRIRILDVLRRDRHAFV